jgi:hypothetical protein
MPRERAGFDQALRQRAIRGCGLIATGVIVATHEGCRVGDNGGFEDSAYAQRWPWALMETVLSPIARFCVQQEDHKVLAIHGTGGTAAAAQGPAGRRETWRGSGVMDDSRTSDAVDGDAVDAGGRLRASPTTGSWPGGPSKVDGNSDSCACGNPPQAGHRVNARAHRAYLSRHQRASAASQWLRHAPLALLRSSIAT